MSEKLDRAGRMITRAAALSEQEAGVVASAPFLLTGVCARIPREQELREAGGIWGVLADLRKKPIPAMILVAALSIGLSSIWLGTKPPVQRLA